MTMTEKNETRMFKYFTIKEVLRRCPNYEKIECIDSYALDSLLLLIMVLDNFRDYLGYPIVINSSYRDIAHNKSAGGVSNSQHILGMAIDFTVNGLAPHIYQNKFIEFLKSSPLERFVGQVIFYNFFIHFGMRTPYHNSLVYYDKRTNKQVGKLNLHSH